MSSKPHIRPLSCTNCRQRKVKCDRVHPCVHCQKSSLDCVFPVRARHTMRRKNGPKATTDELLARLNRMEKLIGRYQVSSEDPSGRIDFASDIIPPSKQTTTRSLAITRSSAHSSDNLINEAEDEPSPKTEEVSSYRLGASFWCNLTQEVTGLREALDDDTEEEEVSTESPSSTVDAARQSSRSALILGAALEAPRDLRQNHPSPRHVSAILEIYITNVDPMLKVIHVPTLRSLVTQTLTNFDTIPHGTHVEPLLFSMYYSSITTLDDNECQENFGQSREDLLTLFMAGIERSLVNADFLTTTSLGVLQALIIFLAAVRANDASSFSWTMAAIAVRLGVGLGIHRESTLARLSPFDAEIRRRVWWSLVILDVQSSEDRASVPLIDPNSCDTLPPRNLHDSDLFPGMQELPLAVVGFTSMMPLRSGHEVKRLQIPFSFTSQVGLKAVSGQNSSYEKALEFIRLYTTFVERDILAHCNEKDPLAYVSATVARLILERVRLSVYHPIRQSDSSRRPKLDPNLLLETSTNLLQCAMTLDTDPALKRFRWYTRTHLQWHALAVTLVELCAQTEGPVVGRAWSIIDCMWHRWADGIADSESGGIWRPMRKLLAKAQSRRDEARKRKMIIPPVPNSALAERDASLSDSSRPSTITPIDSMASTAAFNFDVALPAQQAQSTLPTPASVLQSSTTMLTQDELQTLSLQDLEGIPAFSMPPSGTLAMQTNLEYPAQLYFPDTFSNPGDRLVTADTTMNEINWIEWDEFMRECDLATPPPLTGRVGPMDDYPFGS